jgi:sugar/nucleoside kinase (ribokinase family)
MHELDLFSIGSFTIFDHLLTVERLPRRGEMVRITNPLETVSKVDFSECSANVAAAAARLGVTAGLGMVVGDDFESSGFRRHLLELNVELSGVNIVSGTGSGHAFVIRDSEGDGYWFYHMGVAEDQTSWEAPRSAILSSRAIVVNEMFSQYTYSALEIAKRHHAMTSINGMVGIAGERARGFVENADILFINELELNALMEVLQLDAIEQIITCGPDRLFVTRGPEGCQVITHDTVEVVEAVSPVRYIDPTGAGDAFVGGAMAAILKGFSDIQAARVGSVVASFVLEKWGSQTNLPDWDVMRDRYRSAFGEDL